MVQYMKIPGEQGHEFERVLAHFQIHDFVIRKTRKRRHFQNENDRILSVLEFREHEMRRNSWYHQGTIGTAKHEKEAVFDMKTSGFRMFSA